MQSLPFLSLLPILLCAFRRDCALGFAALATGFCALAGTAAVAACGVAALGFAFTVAVFRLAIVAVGRGFISLLAVVDIPAAPFEMDRGRA